MSKKRYTAEEILKLLEEDAESLQCPADSSSDDEDLVHQAKVQDSDASHYRIPSSEREELEVEARNQKTFKEQLAMEMLQFAEDSAAPPPPPAAHVLPK
ncbi:hypothetical protein GJAV_G00194930 [Gymnothorax javanicus]|nr:hypothetical protein GJAV_G00194930 [Gymnothorax javanicus]